MSENLDSIITELNTQRQIFVDGTSQAGSMQVNTTQYWIPYYSVLALFNGLFALTELNNRLITTEADIVTLKADMANRMLCTKYKV